MAISANGDEYYGTCLADGEMQDVPKRHVYRMYMRHQVIFNYSDLYAYFVGDNAFKSRDIPLFQVICSLVYVSNRQLPATLHPCLRVELEFALNVSFPQRHMNEYCYWSSSVTNGFE